ncbi:MAG: methyltransferase family protein [Chloroflexota bacterium]|nr:MAG: hypothetical protein DLM70_12560 [Chloroflexota bacterium]
MNGNELFSEIDAFLHECAGKSTSARQSFAFWTSRPYITRAEIDMLAMLAHGPLDALALARHMKCKIQGTQDLLDALVAVGILERHGKLYAATASTALYCQAFRPDQPARVERRDDE